MCFYKVRSMGLMIFLAELAKFVATARNPFVIIAGAEQMAITSAITTQSQNAVAQTRRLGLANAWLEMRGMKLMAALQRVAVKEPVIFPLPPSKQHIRNAQLVNPAIQNHPRLASIPLVTPSLSAFRLDRMPTFILLATLSLSQTIRALILPATVMASCTVPVSYASVTSLTPGNLYPS